jgi:hypothetical protein
LRRAKVPFSAAGFTGTFPCYLASISPKSGSR